MKVTVFRLHIMPRDKRYIKVFAFPTRALMYRFYKIQLKITGQEAEYKEDFAAMFQPFTIVKVNRDGTEIKKNHIGNLLCYVDKLGAAIVSHELGHAALHWYELERGDKHINSMEDEESLLHCLYFLTHKFWDRYYQIMEQEEYHE